MAATSAVPDFQRTSFWCFFLALLESLCMSVSSTVKGGNPDPCLLGLLGALYEIGKALGLVPGTWNSCIECPLLLLLMH